MQGGFFDGLLSSIQNPLFMGGVGLMSGGVDGMQRGLFAGNQLQAGERKRRAVESGLAGMNGLTDGERQAFSADPDSALQYIARMAAERNDPMSQIRKRTAEANLLGAQNQNAMHPLDMEYKRAQINSLNRKEIDQNNPANRAKNAARYGLDPNSDSYKSYVLTGRLPREDQQSLTATDKKAILEADESVGSNRAAIQAIDEATNLNEKANSGWLAGARASVGANLPDALVPNFISSPESSQATIDFDNAVDGQALTQLKAIFGGNPTEGERKILLDLQGSSSKPKAVRAEILGRARRLAENRLKLNEQRAIELRGGSYYKPGGGSAAANPMTFENGSGDPLAEAKAAIGRGADPAKVRQRLIENGVDPRGL